MPIKTSSEIHSFIYFMDSGHTDLKNIFESKLKNIKRYYRNNENVKINV